MRISAITFFLFICMFAAVRHAVPAGILFYQGIGLGVLASVIQFAIQMRFCRHSMKSSAKDAVFSFLLIYSFVFTIPTTVDRAYSVRMITHLGQSPSGLTRDEIGQEFDRGFMAQGGVDKRLSEQTATGSIDQHQGRYFLTPFGRFLSAGFRFTQMIFACGRTQ